jgi:hypothetical protein
MFAYGYFDLQLYETAPCKNLEELWSSSVYLLQYKFSWILEIFHGFLY